MGQQAGIVERDATLTASDGVQVAVFIAEPSGAPAAPRLVIAPEIFGLTPWIKSVARRLAREGFRAAAPEIFARETEPLSSDRASWMQRIRRLGVAQAVRDLRGALNLLQQGKAASIGFCLGGALSLLTAAEGGVGACVTCYGRPRWLEGMAAEHPIEAAKRIECPVLGVYGRRDPGIPVEAAEELRAALPKQSELVFYDAGHAFLNDTRPEMYAGDQADLAWAKIIGFLRRRLG
jgi:carboxymethylenebutenolidase